MIKLAVVAVVALGVLVLNPWFGWFGEDDPGFRYDLPEVRAAVEGTWQLTLAPAGGPTRTTTFTLAQGHDADQAHASRTLVRSAAACSARAFVKAAAACVDTTHMPLDVVVLAGAPAAHRNQGMFIVVGTTFEAGHLSVSLDELSISAMVSPRGEVSSAAVYLDHTPSELAATLVRIKP
jgi:hypothetical protein